MPVAAVVQPDKPDEYMGPFAKGPDGKELANSVQVWEQDARHFELVLFNLACGSLHAAVCVTLCACATAQPCIQYLACCCCM
jgi:hypothetical protein